MNTNQNRLENDENGYFAGILRFAENGAICRENNAAHRTLTRTLIQHNVSSAIVFLIENERIVAITSNRPNEMNSTGQMWRRVALRITVFFVPQCLMV